MTLSLLRAARWPDGHADIGVHRFRYAIRPYEGGFAEAGAAAAGYLFGAPVILPEKASEGAAGTMSWFAVEPMDGNKGACGVLIDWVKPAADGSGDLILRLYESTNSFEKVRLLTPLAARAVYGCDALEARLPETPDLAAELRAGAGLALSLKPFEFRTLRFVRP